MHSSQASLQRPQISPNLYALIERILLSGGSLHRFVDSLQVSWPEIAAKLGTPENVCKAQMQLILDILFDRCEFTEEDRELLCRLIESEAFEQEALTESFHNENTSTSQAPKPPRNTLVAIAQYLQRRYFPSYSASLIAREYAAMKRLYVQFKSSKRATP